LDALITASFLSSIGVEFNGTPSFALSLALIRSSAFNGNFSPIKSQKLSPVTLYISSHAESAPCLIPLSGLSTIFVISFTSFSFITSS